MTDVVELQDLTKILANPYVITKSKLGSTTKVIQEKFVCSPKELKLLFDSMGEKIALFQPTKAGFQYLISFTDSTHYENSHLPTLSERIAGSNKSTEKIIFNWSIGHQYSDIENELSITVRISNPMNPYALLQAVMSKDPSETDRLDFEDGCVSVSINGATENTAEEIFAIVQRWASACPQPESITGVNKVIRKHYRKISFLNYWLFPLLYTICVFYYLKDIPASIVSAYSLVAFVMFIYIREATKKFNNYIERWCITSMRFSLFMITGGDSNQQTKIAANSKNNMIKLVGSVALSFLINLIAGGVILYYTNFITSAST